MTPKYHIKFFWSQADGASVADVPDLRSCSAFGDTPAEALAEVEKAGGVACGRPGGQPADPGAAIRGQKTSRRLTGTDSFSALPARAPERFG